MERWGKCLSPQNTAGVSGVNSVAAKSNTIEVDVDHFLKYTKHAFIRLLWCLSSVLQAPAFKLDSKELHLHHVFNLNVHWDPGATGAPEEDIRGHLG